MLDISTVTGKVDGIVHHQSRKSREKMHENRRKREGSLIMNKLKKSVW